MNRATWTYTGGTVCLLVGCLLTIIGIDELRLTLQSGSQAQELTLADLAQKGPAGQAYVSLKHFSYRREGCLATGPGVIGPLRQVWVPLAPQSAGPPAGRDVCAVVMINHAATWNEVDRLLAQGRLTGVIKSRGDAAYPSELEQRNPGLRASQCWEIWEGRQPWALTVVGPMVVGGVLLFALGLFLVDLGRRLSASSVQPLVSVVALMSPLVFLMDGLTQLLRLWPLSKRCSAVLLALTGLCFLGGGGWLVTRGGLLSLEGHSGSLFGGILCVNLGTGVVTLAIVTALRRQAVSHEAEPASQPSQFEWRKAGGYVLAVGAGLLFAGFRWIAEVHPVPAFVPVLCGAGVALVVAGLYLLIVRRGERAQEFGQTSSQS